MPFLTLYPSTHYIHNYSGAILALIMDDSRIGEYDDMFDSYHHLVKVDDHTAIRRVCCKAIWPTAPRDFLVCTTWTKLEDGSIMVCSRSAPDDVFGQQKGYVRGFLNIRFVICWCL